MSRNPSLLIPADYDPVPADAATVEVTVVDALDEGARPGSVTGWTAPR